MKRICDEGRLFLDRNEPLPGDMGNGKHGKLQAKTIGAAFKHALNKSGSSPVVSLRK